MFFVEDNHGLINTEDPSRTGKIGHVPVESVDEIVHPENI